VKAVTVWTTCTHLYFWWTQP